MTSPDHLTEMLVAGYLDHDLPAGERQRVDAHLEACQQCRAEVVEVLRIRDAVHGAPAATPRRQGKTAWPWVIGVAMAAAAAGLVFVPSLQDRATVAGHQGVGPVRAASDAANSITAVGPADNERVSPTGITFTWRPDPAELYRFTLLTESGEPIFTMETTDTVLRLPPGVVPGAGLYFWRVDAIRDGLVASTGVRRLQISR